MRYDAAISCEAFRRHAGVTYQRSANKTATPERQKVMNEAEYFSSEFTDAELDRQADAGEFFLDESGFFLMPTQVEIQEMVVQGEHLLFE